MEGIFNTEGVIGHLMPIDKQSVLDQIEPVITKWRDFSRKYRGPWSTSGPYTQLDEVYEIYSEILATIERIAPIGSSYYIRARSIWDTVTHDNYDDISKVYLASETAAGILRALRQDFDRGYLQRIDDILRAETFSDFLEMAEYLLNEGYKDPAAVLIGGVLEEKLKKLCQKHDIATNFLKEGREIPKRAESLNSELGNHGIYNRGEQKQVTAWLDIRNNAAHSHYDAYSKEQVALRLLGIREFIVRHSN